MFVGVKNVLNALFGVNLRGESGEVKPGGYVHPVRRQRGRENSFSHAEVRRFSERVFPGRLRIHTPFDKHLLEAQRQAGKLKLALNKMALNKMALNKLIATPEAVHASE